MKKGLKYLDDKVETFLPVSTFMICWYFIVMITLAVDYFLTVFFICFQSFKQVFVGKQIALPLQLVVLILDILVSLNTSFIQHGRIISQKKQIRKKYLTSKYFLLDCIVTIVNVIQIIIFTYSPFLNFIVFLKLLKINNFDNLIRKYIIKSSNVKLAYHILKHMMMLVMVCHFIGSFFFYLDIKLIDLGWYSTDDLWVYGSYAYQGIINLPISSQYAYSFYYAVVTLSGVAYGDLTPLNPTEAAYTLLSLLIPLTFYAYILSVVHGEISQRRAKALEVIKFRRIAQKYFEESGIDQSSIPRFINYLSHASSKKADFDNSFLDETAPSIKQEYIRSVVGSNFDFSIFHPLLKPYIKMNQISKLIFSLAEEQAYPSRQSIHPQKARQVKLYYIALGQISEYVLLKQRKNNKFISSGCFFNQHCFYTGLAHRNPNHLFQTYGFTIFYTLKLDKFLKNAQQSEIFQSYHQFRNQVIFQNHILHIQANCFFCDERNHILDACPSLRPRLIINELQAQVNQRNYKFKRKQVRNKKLLSFLRPITIFSGFFNKLKKDQKQQKSTQTEQKQDKNNVLSLKMIDKIKTWPYFDHMYNIIN